MDPCIWIAVAARSKAWVCGHSLAGIVGSNPAGGMDICLVDVVCCQVEVSGVGMITHRSPQCPMSVITKPRKETMIRNRVEEPQKKKKFPY